LICRKVARVTIFTSRMSKVMYSVVATCDKNVVRVSDHGTQRCYYSKWRR
jgi:hypothetical protein